MQGGDRTAVRQSGRAWLAWLPGAMEFTPIILAHEPPFSIGEAEMRPATREILFRGRAGVVEPRVMKVLVALHRARGSVVAKDDLIQLCWEGRVVGEDAINRVISRLRQNAVKDAGGQFRIETITKVGYRLVGDGPTAAATDSTEIGVSGSGAGGFARRQAIGAGVVLAAAAAGLGWSTLRPGPFPEEAGRLIEEGRAELRGATVEKMANAVARFRRATEIAPDSAEAWGALALAYQRQLGSVSSGQESVLMQKARSARERALSLDADNGDAAAAGVLAVPMLGNWQAYERSCRESLRRHPDHSAIHLALGDCLAQVGRGRAALAHVEQADRLEEDPRHVISIMLLLWDQGRLDEAEAVMERGAAQWPRHISMWFSKLYFLAFNNRASEALAMIQGDNRPVGTPEWNFSLAGLQAKALLTRSAADLERAMEATVRSARNGVGFAENAIVFAAAFGRLDQAFELIGAYFFNRGYSIGETRFSREQGVYTRQSKRRTYFLFRSLTAPLRADPRFAEATGELGLQDYWRKSGTTPDFQLHR